MNRAAVILPNSEVISSALVNWTHKDRSARIEIVVGVDYGSHSQTVHDLILSCFQNHPLILKRPEPEVLFREFGPDALIFAGRGHIADVGRRPTVESELRFSIDETLRKNAIPIPYAQRTISFRDWKELGDLLERFTGRPPPP